ncbi:MAG: hypothetical protein EOO07_06505, partial [Chitinophagaceae bacterium]
MKKLFIIPMFIIISILACKKDEQKNSTEEEVFELTDYYIIGRIPATMSNGQTIQKPFVITFDEYGKAHMLREQPGNYTLADGKLKIGYGMVFSIKNKLIIGVMTVALVIWGIWSATQLPVDALPDITNNQVQ